MPRTFDATSAQARATRAARAPTVAADASELVQKATSLDEVHKIINDNPLDPSKEITIKTIIRELTFQEEQVKRLAIETGKSQKFVKSMTLWRAVGSTVEQAAFKLLPHVCDRADYFLAMRRGDVTQKTARPAGENTDVNIGTEDCPTVVKAFDKCKPPAQPYELLKAIALCEDSYHVKLCQDLSEEELGDPDLLKYGDLAIVPALIGAPMRKGKLKTSLLLLWFDLRMGFRCTYGVAPNKSNVMKPVWDKIISLGWHDPSLRLLKSPAATYTTDPTTFELRSLPRKLESVVADTDSNFLLYSIDSADDTATAKAYMEMSRPQIVITRPYADCPNYDDDNPDSAAKVELVYTNQFQMPLSNIRDEAHNAAKTGAEEKKEKLQKKQEELQKANTRLAAASTPEDLANARSRKEAATKAVDNAQKAFDKAGGCIMSNIRPTFVNSYGYATNVSATMVGTFQEPQMYGTHTLERPLGLKLAESTDPEEQKHGIRGQHDQILPALRPNSDTYYFGTNRTKKVEYSDSSGYTKAAVYARYKQLFRDYARANGHDQSTSINFLLPETSSHFNSGSFSCVDLLRRNGVKQIKNAAVALADVAKFYVYLDAVVIGQPVTSRVIPATLHSPDDAKEASDRGDQLPPSILPTTVVSVTDKVTKPKNKFNAYSLEVAKDIVDLLIAKNESGVVAVWGTGLKETAIQKVFPTAPFVAGFKMDPTKNVAVFHVRRESGSSSRLMPIENHCADFDEVAQNVANHVDKEELYRTNMFCVGYHMFTGAITLTTTIESTTTGLDGVPEPDLLICPQYVLYKHTSYRQIDSKCQQVGRGFNDFPFEAPIFKIFLLGEENVLAHCKEYMGAEATLLNESEKKGLVKITNGDGSEEFKEMEWRDFDGSTPAGFFVRPTLKDCLTAVSAFLEACPHWEGQNGLGAAAIGLKAGKMKAKFTLKTTVTDKHDASDFVGELDGLSDDEEVEENMQEAGDRFGVLPEDMRIEGVPYLVCCAIAWFNEKIRFSKISDGNKREYARKFAEVASSEQFNSHGGWKEHMFDKTPSPAEKTLFRETVLQPFMDAHHAGGAVLNYGSAVNYFYKLFPIGSSVADATPEDFGYASIDTSSESPGPSGVVPMDTRADSDPDYNPNSDESV